MEGPSAPYLLLTRDVNAFLAFRQGFPGICWLDNIAVVGGCMIVWGPSFRTDLERLEKRIDAMESDYARVVELEADWQDWLHKIRNVLARLNTRAAREEEVQAEKPRRMNPAAARLLGYNHEE